MKKQHKISTVISYCTNDYQFIKHAIDSVRPFSRQVIVPVVDHFFDGTEENLVEVMLELARNPERVTALSKNCRVIQTAEAEVALHLKLIENLRKQTK